MRFIHHGFYNFLQKVKRNGNIDTKCETSNTLPQVGYSIVIAISKARSQLIQLTKHNLISPCFTNKYP